MTRRGRSGRSLLRGSVALRLAAFAAGACLALSLSAPALASKVEELAPVRAFRNFDKRTAPSLPQSTVMALLQDAKGVLWIATLDGVGCFEGEEICPLALESGAPTTGPYRALAQRQAGGLYAAGLDRIHRLAGQRWERFAAPGSIVSLVEAAHGQLFGVEESGGLWRARDLAAGSWERVALPPGAGRAVAVAKGPDGTLWVAAESQVFRLSEAGLFPTRTGPLPGEGLISTFLAASDGSLWAGTRGGELFVARPGEAQWSQAAAPAWDGGSLRCLAEDRRGRIWAGGDHGRLAHGRRGETFAVWGPAQGVRDASVVSLLADREGSLWIGLNGWGLQQWIGEAWSHRTLWWCEERLPPRVSVFRITPTVEGFLAAIFARGLWRWDGQRMQQIGRAQGLSEDTRCAVEPAPGTLWVGTRYGLQESIRGAPFRRTLSLPSGFVTAIERSPEGEWLAATSTAGIFRRQQEGWVPATELNAVLPSSNVRALLWRSNGELWIGTVGGVVTIREGRAERLLPGPSVVLPDGINCLLEVEPEEVWLGGFGGIGVMRPAGGRLILPSEGLPGRTIYSLLRAPDGAIWAGGSGGVGRFADSRWTVYDSSNGLLEEECNLHGLALAPDGALLVGTMGSLARFDPGVRPLLAPPLRLFWHLPAELVSEPQLRLPATTDRIRLAWHAPWLLPQRVEYRTRLRPLHATWSEPTRERTLTLLRPGPGEWLVEVSARLAGSGVEGWTAPLSAELLFLPHFWERKAVHAGAAILGLALLLTLYRLTTGRLARRAAALNREVARRTAALEESNRQLAAAHARLLEITRSGVDHSSGRDSSAGGVTPG